MRLKLTTSLLLWQAVLWIHMVGLHAQTFARLDSIHFDRGIDETPDFAPERRVFVLDHDAQGRPLTTLTNRKGPAANWLPWRRRQHDYQNGKLAQIRIQYWNPAVQDWENAFERTYTYHPSGALAVQENRKAPAPGMPLENILRLEYQYNNSDELLQTLLLDWDGANWANKSRELWSYQPDGQIQATVQQAWDGTAWQPVSRNLRTYDAVNMRLRSATSEDWNAQALAWEGKERKLYLDNGQFNWTSIVQQTWDPAVQEWTNQNRELMQYSGMNFEGKIYQVWENNTWVAQSRNVLEVAGDTLLIRQDRWEDLLNDWEPSRLSTMVYDENNLLLLSQGLQQWNPIQSAWLNDSTTQRSRLYWSALSSRLSDPEPLPCACTVANPWRKGSAINCPDLLSDTAYRLVLTDLSGRPVRSLIFSGSDTPTLDDAVPAGLYLLAILDAEQRLLHLQKLIIP